ncbi:hypothetical protein FOVSG1_006742 [Fusarium oxysporum f. sp. vasinfectum]
MQPKIPIRVPQACDACRARKVKCNGQQPCPPCEHLNLHCKFLRQRGTGGGSKARVAPRRNRILTQLRSAQADGQPSLRDLRASTVDPTLAGSEVGASDPSPGTVVEDSARERIWLLSLLPLYEQLVYVMNPIITCAEFRRSIDRIHVEPEEHGAFVYAAAAVAIHSTPLTSDQDSPQTPLGSGAFECRTEASRYNQLRDMVNKSFAARFQGKSKGVMDHLAQRDVTVRKIMTCVFLAASLMGLRRRERAFTSLREAINMMQLLPYEEGDEDLPRKQRLYWQLFIHERFAAIALGLPPVLTVCGYPQPDVALPTYIQTGFGRLCRLFSIMDNDFMRYWTKYQGSSEKMGITFWNPEPRDDEMTASWIERKHQELDADERSQHQNDANILHSVENDRDSYSSSSPEDTEPSWSTNVFELQNIDLQVTRLWIRTLLWQLAVSRMLLNSSLLSTAHQAMSLTFPARDVVIQLRDHVSRLGSKTSFSPHGSGILDKLFEITNSIADVLLLVPRDQLDWFYQGNETGPSSGDAEFGNKQLGGHLLQAFEFLVHFLFSFDRIDHVQRKIIEQKSTSLGMQSSGLGWGTDWSRPEPPSRTSPVSAFPKSHRGDVNSY